MIDLKNISFDYCIKCTICTSYCPVAKVTKKFPGPKQSGPDSERFRIKDPNLVDKSIFYCTNCKICEVVCPSNVNISHFIQNAKLRLVSKGEGKLRDKLISDTDLLGSMGVRFSKLLNRILKMEFIKSSMDFLIGIDKRRRFPEYSNYTFKDWFKSNYSINKYDYKRSICYFSGCFVNFTDPNLGKDFIYVMDKNKIKVILPEQKCCGIPLVANGLINKAYKKAKFNIKNLTLFINKGIPIIATSSSCALSLKHDYNEFLNIKEAYPLKELSFNSTEFLISLLEEGEFNNDLYPLDIKVAYHAPCHLKFQGGENFTIELLKQIPNLKLENLNSECCGIAGTFGFKKENYKISYNIGYNLFKKIEKTNPDFVVTDCETCKLQIETFTKAKVLHPINLLAMAYKGPYNN